MSGTGERPGLLVFGDDGSPDADVAWLWVCNHRWPAWTAEVVTADPPPVPGRVDRSEQLVEWESPHPRALVSQSELARVRHLNAVGDPRVVLGAREDADLIVVGMKGRGRVRGLLMGSTTDWLLQHPPAPLAVIRSATPTRTVLACVDGSPHAQRAVEVLARLPWSPGIDVVVLAVDDDRSRPGDGIEGAVSVLSEAGARAVPRQLAGRPSTVILDQIDEVDPQLVVLGTRGLTGLERLRVGSTAAAVVRSSARSALLAFSPS